MLTKSNNTQQKLSIEQLNAIDLLITGQPDREVAELVNVNRSTVTQWPNHDADFMAELNRRRQEVWGSQVERLRNLVSKAVDVLEADLDADNLKLRQNAAIHILKAVKLYGEIGQPTGRTDPDGIREMWAESEELKQLLSRL